MKKTISIIAAAAALAGAFFFSSCNRKEVATIREFTVRVNMPLDFPEDAVYNGAVGMIHQGTGKIYEALASNGEASFKKIPYGVYEISASWALSNAEFKAMAPDLAADLKSDIFLNSGTATVTLATDEDAAEPVVLTLTWSVPSTLVISRLYNFGTLNLAGKAFNIDKYLEIYNNSDVTQYVDGLFLGEAYGSAVSPSPYTDVATADVCYLQRVVRIPGTGNQYPVEPGKSIVVAQNAMNHIKADVVTNTVDLSGADFECYVQGAPASMFPADNADVPNIEEIFGASNSTAKFFAGQGTVPVLFKMDLDAFYSLDMILAPGTDAYGTQYAFYCKALPVSAIIDAVDTYRVGFESRASDHVPSSVDAGRAAVNQKNISLRKIAYFTEDGRAVLQDTNNSTSDFVIVESTDGSVLVPRKYDLVQIQPAD